MARGRMIDRHFAKSKKLNSVTRDARLIYATILPFLDREGRHVAEPIVLKANIFRWSDITLNEIAKAIADLAEAGLVNLYADADNAAIIQYTQFDTFNSPNKREAESELPGPDDASAMQCRDESILACLTGPRETHVQRTGHAPTTSVENVNDNVNVNDNENTSMSPTGDARSNLAVVKTDELQALVDAWNEHRGNLPAVQKLTSTRRSKLRTLVKDLGGIDKAYAAIAIAAKEVSNDDFWKQRQYGFDNLLAGQKVIQKAETAWNRGTFDREQAEKDRLLAALGPN